MNTIWVIGSANIDLVSKVTSLPLPGQTVQGSDLVTTFGGKGANQAVAAARLGGKVAFVGCLGADEHGASYLAHLANEGIDISHAADSPRPSGCAMIVVAEGGENMIVVCPGANQDLRPEHLHALERHLSEGDLVLLQFEVPMETNLRAVQLARAAGARVLLNASPAQSCDVLWEAGIDVLIINEHEARFYQKELGVSLEALRERVREAVVVTHGAEPALVFLESEKLEIPAPAVEPVDTVGAGDTFTGALAVALAEGQAWNAAITFAHAAAALSTLSLGAQAAMPRRGEVGGS